MGVRLPLALVAAASVLIAPAPIALPSKAWAKVQAGPTTLGASAEHGRGVDSLLAKFGGVAPGCAIGVYRSGEILFTRGYGMADVERAVPITPSTVFNVASLSKQFTAFAIALLAQRGKLTLDDDIREYLPEIAKFGDPITVANLVHHTSGLRDYGSLLEMGGWRLDQPLSREAAIDVIARQRTLNFAPGAEHQYNNTNYVLLALIVERVDGRSFRDFAAQEIFAPLGMKHSEVRWLEGPAPPALATNYTLHKDGKWRSNTVWSKPYAQGATAVHTTLEDLARWNANFDDHRVGGPAVIAMMQTVGRLNSGKAISYAFGQELGEYRGLKTVSHTGAGGGNFILTRFPDQRLTVARLCNRYFTEPSAYGLEEKVADRFLAGQFPAAKAPEVTLPTINLPPAQIARHACTYWGDGGPMRFRAQDGRLIYTEGGENFSLRPVGPGRFHYDELRATFTFHGVGDDLLNVVYRTGSQNGRRHPDWTPSEGQLLAMAGSYRNDELGIKWSLRRDGTAIVLRRPGFPDRKLAPTYRDHLSLTEVDDIGSRDMEVVLGPAVRGKISRIAVTRGRARNVEFIRTEPK